MAQLVSFHNVKDEENYLKKYKIIYDKYSFTVEWNKNQALSIFLKLDKLFKTRYWAVCSYELNNSIKFYRNWDDFCSKNKNNTTFKSLTQLKKSKYFGNSYEFNGKKKKIVGFFFIHGDLENFNI